MMLRFLPELDMFGVLSLHYYTITHYIITCSVIMSPYMQYATRFLVVICCGFVFFWLFVGVIVT